MIEIMHPFLFLVIVLPFLAWLCSLFLPQRSSRWTGGLLLAGWMGLMVWLLMESFGTDDPRELFASVLWPMFQTPALYADLGLRGGSVILGASLALGGVVAVAYWLTNSASSNSRQRILALWLVATVVLWSRNGLLAAGAFAVWQIAASGTGRRDGVSRLLGLSSAGLVLAGFSLLALYNHQAPDRWGLGSADWKALELFWGNAKSSGASVNNVHLLAGLFTLAFVAAMAGSGLEINRSDGKKREGIVSWLLAAGIPAILVVRLAFLWERCSPPALWTFLALMGGGVIWALWWLLRKGSTKALPGVESASRDWGLIARRQGVAIVTSSLAVWGWFLWTWLN